MVKVSVIIPVYNVEKYLQECLDSVINQTLRDIEIICVNDGSSDSTPDILNRQKDERIKIINQENRGLSAARNTGLDNATGDYILFLDSDDYLKLTALEELYVIGENKSLDCVMFKLIDFDMDTGEKRMNPYFEMDKLKETVGDDVFSHEDIGKMMFQLSVTAPGKLYRRELIENIRFPEGLIFEDNPFYFEMMLNVKRAYFYDRYLYYRRIRHDSITQSATDRFWEWLIISDMLIDISKRYGFYEEYGDEVYKKKISNTYRIFTETNEEDRPEFLKKIKINFNKIKDDHRYDYVFRNISGRLKFIFAKALECKTPQEFEFEVGNYDLKRQNKKLEKRNKKLKKQIRKYKKDNDVYLKSTSWKVTRPFRKFTGIFRR